MKKVKFLRVLKDYITAHNMIIHQLASSVPYYWAFRVSLSIPVMGIILLF